MGNYTTRKPHALTGADFRALRHRIKQTHDDNYSAARFAKDLRISESLLQFIETDQRAITPRVAAAFRKLEREQIFCIKEQEQVDAQTATWLVDALARHLSFLSTRDRARARRMLKG